MTVRLSAQQKPLPWLSFNPSLTQSWRDGDLRSGKTRFEGVRTNTFNASGALAQTFYGLFHPRLGPVEALRHVIKPNLRLRYQASRTDTGGVVGFGGRGSPWKQSRRVDIGLDNGLWAKVLAGEKENKIRLIQLNMSTSYDFDRDQRPLSDLSTSLTVDVGKRFDTRLRLGSEFYDDEDRFQALPRLKRFEVSSSLRLNSGGSPSGLGTQSPYSGGGGSSYLSAFSGQGGGSARGSSSGSAYGFESGLRDDIGRTRQRANLLLSHYFARTRTTTRTTTRSWLRLGAGAGWRRWYFNYSLNYNLHLKGTNLFSTKRITAELLSIRMEFHDWTATFNMEPHRFLRDRAFYFKAQLKDIPQLKFERGDRRG